MRWPHGAWGLVLGVLLLVPSMALAALQGPPKAPQTPDATDRVRQHVEVVAASDHRYTVVFRGTIDGVMTRDPVGYQACRQGFQPNVSVLLENVGDTEVVNPWLIVNGQRNWRTVQDIVAEATAGFATEREKAIALWEFQRHRRFHACTWDLECDDPVKMFNVYGYTLCGDDAHVLTDLWRRAGLKVRRGYPVGHCTAEVFFDGRFHLLDGDENIICLLRDNETIASEADIVRDHDLMKRTHTYGILSGHSPITDQFSASLQGYEGERHGELPSHIGHAMHFTLRPGESIEWRWDHIGKQYTAGTIPADGIWRRNGEGDLLVLGGRDAYDKLCNGRLRYAPDFRKPWARRGVESAENVAWNGTASGSGCVGPADAAKPAFLVWRIESPYVIVGGQVRMNLLRQSDADQVEVGLSSEGKSWQTLWRANSRGRLDETVVFDEQLSPRGKPQYHYLIRMRMQSAPSQHGVGLRSIVFNTDVQMAPLSLPELEVGTNAVRYLDETKGPHKVRIRHEWIECTSNHPPQPPAAPVFPAERATVEGTRLTFKWQPAIDPEAEGTVDYHLQLCARKDMRWGLSPNLDRLISLTPDKGKEQYAVPYVGLLNPRQEYFWRVRAKDAKGVWGPWSRAWSFRCEAPGVPLDVRTEADEAAHTVTLHWSPNPVGRRPVRYKVYGSNEQGFTASDTEYVVLMGRGFCANMDEYNRKSGREPDCGEVKTPPNLVAETTATELVVAGPAVPLPNANRAFYRVVAVDEKGNGSGPSDYAEAPRPFVYTTPPTRARVGRPYRYQALAIFSIGDLKCKAAYNAAFWDRERLTYSFAKAPAWLIVEATTGVVSGTPARAGEFEVTLRVENSRGKRTEQGFVIRVAE